MPYPGRWVSDMAVIRLWAKLIKTWKFRVVMARLKHAPLGLLAVMVLLMAGCLGQETAVRAGEPEIWLGEWVYEKDDAQTRVSLADKAALYPDGVQRPAIVLTLGDARPRHAFLSEHGAWGIAGALRTNVGGLLGETSYTADEYFFGAGIATLGPAIEWQDLFLPTVDHDVVPRELKGVDGNPILANYSYLGLDTSGCRLVQLTINEAPRSVMTDCGSFPPPRIKMDGETPWTLVQETRHEIATVHEFTTIVPRSHNFTQPVDGSTLPFPLDTAYSEVIHSLPYAVAEAETGLLRLARVSYQRSTCDAELPSLQCEEAPPDRAWSLEFIASTGQGHAFHVTKAGVAFVVTYDERPSSAIHSLSMEGASIADLLKTWQAFSSSAEPVSLTIDFRADAPQVYITESVEPKSGPDFATFVELTSSIAFSTSLANHAYLTDESLVLEAVSADGSS